MRKLFCLIISTLIILFPFAFGCGEELVDPPSTPTEETFYYSVTLNLDYVIPCTYRGKTNSELALIEVARNDRISNLTYAVPIGDTEYEFFYWEYVKSDGSKIKITSSTKFTTELFGEQENVTINAICVSEFTPRV